MDLSLQGHFFQTINPAQVVHRLTDDSWSHFDFGPWRVAVRATDLTQVRAARHLAQAIAAQAGFWDGDLAAIEARLLAEADAHVARGAEHTGPEPASEPVRDEPFGDDDPRLDAAVARVVELAAAQRDAEEEGDL